MIILNFKKGNNFFTKIKEIYESMLNDPYMACPNCHSSELIKWGSYIRNITYIDDKLKYDMLRIRRVRCNKCKHTHALIPSFIIPYKICLLDVILQSLLDSEITIKISMDTVVKWHKQFNKILPYLKTMFQNIPKTLIIEKLLQNLSEYYSQYFLLFRKILMMNRFGVVGMASF